MFALERFTNQQIPGKEKNIPGNPFHFRFFNADSLEDTPQIVRRTETEPIKSITRFGYR